MAHLKCNFICKDECQRETRYSIKTVFPYKNITEYVNGPGFKVTRLGFLLKLYSTRNVSEDTYLENYFEKALNKKEFSKPDADVLCDMIFNK
jgi:hypothetical protein